MGHKSRENSILGPMEAKVEKMDAQLHLWTARINGLAARGWKTSAQARIKYRYSIDDLKAKRAVTQAKVDKYKAAGSEKWEEHKAGIERAWSDLEASYWKLITL